MSSEELELQQYEYQLTEIDRQLKSNPSDEGLLELKGEITNLVNLLRDALGKSAKPQASTSSASTSASAPTASSSGSTLRPTSTASTSASASTSTFAAADKNKDQLVTGSDILARWHKDGKFYPARIASVSGSTSDPVYTVIFTIDKSTEVVRKADVKTISDSKKRALQDAEREEREKKKQAKTDKKEHKEEGRKARVAEQNAKQSTWQSFAKKSAKKGISIPGLSGESQFRSPDNPYGKVGVVGSGKGMTSYEQKKRTKFLEE